MIDFIEVNDQEPSKSGYLKFVIKKIPSSYQKRIEECDKKFNDSIASKISSKQKVKSICFNVAIISIFIVGILGILILRDYNKGINSILPFIISIGIFIIIFIVAISLNFVYGKKIKTIFNSDEAKKITQMNIDLENDLKKELGVNVDATVIDIFARHIKINNNKVINSIKNASYAAHGLYAYKENNYLYLSDTYELIRLDLEKVTKIRHIKEKITFINWNKKVSYSDKKFKEFGVKVLRSYAFCVSSYYEIDLKIKNEDYCLRIPGYEKEFMENNFDNIELGVKDEVKK